MPAPRRYLIVEAPDTSAEVDFFDFGLVSLSLEKDKLRIVVKVPVDGRDDVWSLHEFEVPKEG